MFTDMCRVEKRRVEDNSQGFRAEQLKGWSSIHCRAEVRRRHRIRELTGALFGAR